MAVELFGFEVKRKEEETKDIQSFVDKSDEDGATTVAAHGAYYGTVVDLDGNAESEAKLVTSYRKMEQHPEIRRAIDDIINELVVIADDDSVVDINLDNIELSESLKKRVTEEFGEVLRLMDFSNKAYDIVNRYYVDGRYRYHIIIDESNTKQGIKELRYIDPRKIKKIREIEEVTDPKTNVSVKKTKNEYFIYKESGYLNDNNLTNTTTNVGIRIAKDSVAEVTTGMLNETNKMVLGYLHQAMKPLNQLNALEDASVIYRLSRAPERRIFYIDVGNLPKAQAEKYLHDMMTKHKNKLVYDASTGAIRDERKHMTMLEDFWLPRREGRGTEVTTLPGGQNLGQMEDIMYFQRNLYKSLNVPVSRLDSETGFTIGRSSEITRDEIKFSKFISRIRARFSIIFDELLEKQLTLKNVMSADDFQSFKNQIKYDFKKDNHFQELKEAEILRERINTIRDMEDLIGRFYSNEWIFKNVLQMTDEEIESMRKEIDEDKKNNPPEENSNF